MFYTLTSVRRKKLSVCKKCCPFFVLYIFIPVDLGIAHFKVAAKSQDCTFFAEIKCDLTFYSVCFTVTKSHECRRGAGKGSAVSPLLDRNTFNSGNFTKEQSNCFSDLLGHSSWKFKAPL